MKKLVTITKTTLMIMSIIAMIGFVGSCDEKEDTIWDDNLAPTLIEVSPSSAMEGDEVTITGKYFSSVAQNTVSFNGIEATVTAANISRIIAVVPVGATSGELTVIKNGKASTNSLAYTIIQPITPTLTAISPVRGKIGDVVTISGTEFSSNPSDNIVKFNGVQASVSASTETTITTSVPAGATTGEVTVTRDRESNGLLFEVFESHNFSVPITESWDDVEEGALNGAMANESSDLEIGEYDTWTQDGIEQGVQTLGLRFNNIDIPANANILSANIQFTCDATGSDPCEMTIYGENVGNALPFTEDFYNVSTRSKTQENVVWSVPPWLNAGDAGAAERTSDIASIVQAIVNRSDWSAGNSMVFILAPSGVSLGVTSSSAGREAEAIDGTAASVLTIIYE